MPPRLRRLAGSLMLLFLVVVYALIATTIAEVRLGNSSPWAHLLFFALTGLLWVLPAMWIIKWMLKTPPREQ